MLDTIIENLSPIVGAKFNSIKWSPTTGYRTAKQLRLASLVCLDIDNDVFYDGPIRYEFKNKLSIAASSIHSLARQLDTTVIDTTYVLTTTNSSGATNLYDALFLYANSKMFNDSAIFDVLESNRKLRLSKYYKHVLFILLDAFSLRWSLFSLVRLEQDYEYGELGSERLDRLINNIRYVRARLEDEDVVESSYLMHHLQTLLLNVEAAKYELGKKYIEVNRR